MDLEKQQQRDELDPSGPDAQQYRSELHRYLIRRLRSSEDARDLAQEAYLRYLQLPDHGAIRKPAGYLFRIAVNLIYEWRLRRDRSAVTYNSELADKCSNALPDNGVDVCEQLASAERLRTVLEQIPLTYRRVLIMSKCEGLTHEEIAARLNLSPESVMKYLARATAYARRAQWD